MITGISAGLGFSLIAILTLLLRHIHGKRALAITKAKQTQVQRKKQKVERRVWDELVCHPDVRTSQSEKTRGGAQSYYDYANRSRR